MGRTGRRVSSIAVVVLLGVVSAPAAWAAEHPVDVQDNQFVPAEVEVVEGDTVVWTQSGGNPHSVTADDGSFDSHPNCFPACMQQGESYPREFPEAGEFPYYCKVHGGPGGQGMSGVVIVNAATQPTTSPSPSNSPSPSSSPTDTATSPTESTSPSSEGTETDTGQPTPSPVVQPTGGGAPSELPDTGGGSGLAVVAVLAALTLGAGGIAAGRRRPA